MSKIHRRFEPLEPRFLLSGRGFVDSSFSAVKTQATFSVATDLSPTAHYSPADVQTQKLHVAEIEDLVEEFSSPTCEESSVSASPVEQLLPQDSSIDSKVASFDSKVALSMASQQVFENSDAAATEVEIVTADNNTLSLDPVVAVKPAVSRDLTFSNTKTLEKVDVAVKESASTVADNTTQTSNTTQTLADNSISVDKPSKEVAVESSAFVTLSESKITAKTFDSKQSLQNAEQRPLSQADVTEEAVDNSELTANTQADKSVTGGSDRVDEKEPSKDKDLAEIKAETDDDEFMDSRKVWLAAAQEPENSVEMDSSNAADYNPDVKFQQQMMVEEDRSVTPQPEATVVTNAQPVSRQISNQVDQDSSFAKVADCVFSEEQAETGGRLATSQTLAQAEGALLLVALGKPLTRLATGDVRVDAASVDCGSSGARTTFDRSRRNRRKTEEARDRWQRHGDARNRTWLPPEELPEEISHELTDAVEQTVVSRTAAESIQPHLADEVIFSHLDFTELEDRYQSLEMWLPTLPSADDWDSYGMLSGAAIVTLTGTISALAVDRHRRMHKAPHRVSLPIPAYNGRTLARG